VDRRLCHSRRTVCWCSAYPTELALLARAVVFSCRVRCLKRLAALDGGAQDDTVNKAKKKKGFPVLGLLLLVGAGVGAYFGLEKAKEQDSKGKKPAGKPSLKKK
jgi:hypothetical protein